MKDMCIDKTHKVNEEFQFIRNCKVVVMRLAEVVEKLGLRRGKSEIFSI